MLDDLIEAAQGVDIWGFSEVADDVWASLFEHPAGQGEAADFSRILGSAGALDRRPIVYNGDRFDVVRHFELSHIIVGGMCVRP